MKVEKGENQNMQKNIEQEQIKMENDQIEVIVNYHGAELRSLKKKATEQEYLWNADAKYWGRTSPVLFPFVGGVKNKVYRHEGKEYPMNQHGFARDMEFSLVSQSADEVWFALEDTEETYKVYPFHFHLEIGYRLEDASVSVMWKVKNINNTQMHFAIGAHPAFFCPLHEGEKQSEYYLGFRDGLGNAPEALVNTVFGEGGVVTTQKKEYKLADGCLSIDEHLFDGDALVIEDHQIQRVTLMDPQKKEYLAVEFDAPLAGIWSPPKKQAPFVCIEPWYGRCDSEIFDGELKDRDWENTLAAGAEFEASYKIIVE